MAYKGYINPEVAKMYGIPYSKLTAKQKRILHEDSVRRAKLIEEREQDVLRNGLKAFEDEAKMERILASIYKECQQNILADVQGVTLIKVLLLAVEGFLSKLLKRLLNWGKKRALCFIRG